MISKELTSLLNSIDNIVNNEDGYSWQVKKRMVLQAFKEARCIEALDEFVSWFQEEKINDA